MADFLGHHCGAPLLPMVKLEEDTSHTPDPHAPLGIQPPVSPLARPHGPRHRDVFTVAEEALLIQVDLHDVEEPIALPRDPLRVPLAGGWVSFGIFVNIEMQTPQAFHLLKHALMKQPPFAAPAPDTLVLKDGVSSNPDRFQKRCLRLTSHTGFAELCQDSQCHVSGERIELLDEIGLPGAIGGKCTVRESWAT